MAYPPNRDGLTPPKVWRETMPENDEQSSTLCHWDLHVANAMFGEYSPRNDDPTCHRVTPVRTYQVNPILRFPGKGLRIC